MPKPANTTEERHSTIYYSGMNGRDASMPSLYWIERRNIPSISSTGGLDNILCLLGEVAQHPPPTGEGLAQYRGMEELNNFPRAKQKA
jgi:hypothetical protein